MLDWESTYPLLESIKVSTDEKSSIDSHVMLMNKQGLVIFAPEFERRAGAILTDNLFTIKSIADIAEGEEIEGYTILTDEHNQVSLMGYAHSQGYGDYDGLGWTALVKHNEALAFAPITKMKKYLIISTIALMILIIGAASFFARHLTSRSVGKAISEYIVFVKKIANGDLTVKMDTSHMESELRILGDYLNDMVSNLKLLASQIKESTANITSAASEITASANQQTAGANEQSAAVNQTKATVDQIRQTANQSAEKTKLVAEMAKKTVQISQSGQQAVSECIEGMDNIKQKVELIAENILSLSEQTQQIGDTIAAVNDITEQSNVLALNASIEAARAGEHGKGFAVVAAQKSKIWPINPARPLPR